METSTIVGVLIFFIIWVLYRSNCKTIVIRFYKPSCKYCVESQQEWDRFKKIVSATTQDIEIVDVNTENTDAHTKYWTTRYKINSVPYVVKETKWLGRSVEFNDSRTLVNYLTFAEWWF
jgi:hypothetical protein